MSDKLTATRNPPPYQKRVLIKYRKNGTTQWQIGTRIKTDINGDYYELETSNNNQFYSKDCHQIDDWQELPN